MFPITARNRFMPRFLMMAGAESKKFSSFKVGDKIPVNFMKEKADPLILSNDQYPDWVHTLHIKVSFILKYLFEFF